MTIENLEIESNHLADVYKADVVKGELFSEISHLKQIHKSNIIVQGETLILKPLDLLNKISTLKLNSLFPNVCIALRMFLTLPVTVATGERSFSKLKIIKNKMRNSTGQERLVSLSILSIEHDLSREVDFSKVIDLFAGVKARRVPL